MSVNLNVQLSQLLEDAAYLKKRRAYNATHALDYYYRKQAIKYGISVEEYKSMNLKGGRPKKAIPCA